MHSLGPRDCPDIRILIRFDARRPVAPRLADGYWNLRHGYNAWIKQIQKEERFQSGKCVNYWDCTRDWNGGILVFPRDGNFLISFVFRFRTMLVYHSTDSTEITWFVWSRKDWRNWRIEIEILIKISFIYRLN